MVAAADPAKTVGFWPIAPVAAPRQVRRDRFKPSPAVQRYRAFRDVVRLAKVWQPAPGDSVLFLIEMPASWSAKKRRAKRFTGHESKPDLDNLLKALLDATHADDAHVWALCACKLWHDKPGIMISRAPPDWSTTFAAARRLMP